MTSLVKQLGDSSVRYDWYQSERLVVLNIFKKNIDDTKLKIACESKSITIRLPDISEPLQFNLSHDVISEKMEKKCSASKLELKFLKVEDILWNKLEGEDPVPKSIPKSSSDQAAPYKQKNWDAVLQSENIEEGDPLNDMFQKIYSGGSEEQRRAMNKSFSESGGTVLSTNWEEVGQDRVTAKPPEGTEYKTWN